MNYDCIYQSKLLALMSLGGAISQIAIDLDRVYIMHAERCPILLQCCSFVGLFTHSGHLSEKHSKCLHIP